MQSKHNNPHSAFHIPLTILVMMILATGCAKDFYIPDASRYGFIVGTFPEEEWIVTDFDTSDFTGQPVNEKLVDINGDSIPDLKLYVNNKSGSGTTTQFKATIRILNDSIELNSRILKQNMYACLCGDQNTGVNVVHYLYTDPAFMVCPDTCIFETTPILEEFCRVYEEADTVFFDTQWADYSLLVLGTSISSPFLTNNLRVYYQMFYGENIWNESSTLAFRIRNGNQYRWGTVSFTVSAGDPSRIEVHQSVISRNYLTLSRSMQ
jgi:hypothetical protein